ncbi:MAG: methyltransferase domain-containing protein [Flavisolibacter sp.]
MSVFSKRSLEKEWLDRYDVPFEAIHRNMEELDVINRRLGGHRTSLNALNFIRKKFQEKDSFTIAEIGSGGGDNLAAVQRWAQKKRLQVSLTGIDINPHCVAFSEGHHTGIKFINSDYRSVSFSEKPDIIFSSLFCHHFTDEELLHQLQWMSENSRLAFFINDLHRHPFAYHSIKVLTRLFSKSALVKNDAPLSVLRGLRKKEWLDLLKQAGLSSARLRWCWAFRWQIIVWKQDAGTAEI